MTPFSNRMTDPAVAVPAETGPEIGLAVALPSRTVALDAVAGELSAAFLRVPAEGIDAALERSLQLIGEALHAGSAVLVEFTGAEPPFQVAASWNRPGTVPLTDDRSWSRWLIDHLARGEQVRVGPAHDAGGVPLGRTLGVPVSVAGERVCGLAISTREHAPAWDGDVLHRVQLLAEIQATAIFRRRQARTVRFREAELARLTTRLRSEARYLREEIDTLEGFAEIVGDSAPLKEALDRVREVAATDATVLLVGDTGTGKELFARAVHDRSPRRHRPLVRINCAALPPTLIESELFGHERGAFTGAINTRQGRFELADKSTIFLDEIGDLPLELQAKLLRVLQEGEFERVGSSQIRRVDVRVIAATHRDLSAAIASGEFRADLYYRLSVFPIHVPALRERLEDIPQLVWFFVHRRQHALHRRITDIPPAVMDALKRYGWPGNVRELENVVERAMIRSAGSTLALDSTFGQTAAATPGFEGDTLAALERRHIEHVLRRCGWRINGKGNAAEHLNLHPNTLRFRMKKLGIARPGRLAPSSGPRSAIADHAGAQGQDQ